MKISIDIDCTPKEARQFLGLPDVEPLQDLFLKELEKRMVNGLSPEDFEMFFKSWMPMGTQNWDKLQNLFWNAATGTTNKSK
ncbi:MAG: hypothetical protein CMF31_06685 [Kordiimonas sp.]|nr:hypothetical protein [Kordiimonas sp.]|tara:strand:- start:5057 stop:5302 length:246 start_codon:yes stop_codon:yes gene_type:complete